MIIVLILVVLWGVVLGPSIYRKVRNSTGDRSITSFHKSLDLLERSGPKVVQPAYRLADPEGATKPIGLAVPPPPPTIKQPTLVLLGPSGQGGAEQMKQRYEEYYAEDDYSYPEDTHYTDEYDDYIERAPYGASMPSASLSRREAALRRRNILFGLVGAVVVTALLGMFMSMFFYLTVLSMIATAAYIGLMAWAATHGMIGEKGYERHVAHGEAEVSYDRYGDDRYEEVRSNEHRSAPVASTRAPADEFFDDDVDDDEWWDQPRQAVAR